jgi:hypothetical protein
MKRAQRGARHNQSTVASVTPRFKQQDDLELDYLDGEDFDAEHLDTFIEIEKDFEEDDSLDEAQLRD